MTATTPYVDATEAQDYFDERLNSSAWEDATTTEKDKALKQATRAIDRLKFIGTKTVSTQENEFPRGGDTVCPDAIKQATCELALQLLDEVDINYEVENLAATSNRFGQAQTQYNRDFALAHIRAGIPSLEAWELLLPFLADPLALALVRGK